MNASTLHTVAGPSLPAVTLDPAHVYSLGRASSQTIRLEDPGVSRRHAQLAFSGGQWTITDLGSRHGTTINGIRVEPDQATSLRDGDRIRIGPWTFALLSGQPRSTSLLSLDDTRRRLDSVTSIAREELGTLAERRLALLMRSAREIHRASDEGEVARGVVKALLDGAGFGRAALIRPMLGCEEFEVLAVASSSGLPASAAPLSPSRTLLQEASQGRIVRMDEEPSVQQAHSIVHMGVSQAICAPVYVGESIEAYAYVDSVAGGSRPEKDVMAYCGAVADLCGLALSNLRRHALQIRQNQLIRDLEAARDVQRRLMPADKGRIGSIRYHIHLQPGRHVAGDLFGIVPLIDSRTAVFLGDVSGKGMGAAILMATAQTHLVASLRHGAGVVECVRTVNQFVAQHSAEREFVTLFLGIIDTEARTLTCVDAGHGYAALVCPGIGAERINVAGGLPIGIDTVANYGSSELALPEGCRLVLFSDGIPEQRSPEGEEFGFGRVLEILNHCTDMEADITAVTNGLRAFAESDAFADDVTMASIGMV